MLEQLRTVHNCYTSSMRLNSYQATSWRSQLRQCSQGWPANACSGWDLSPGSGSIAIRGKPALPVNITHTHTQTHTHTPHFIYTSHTHTIHTLYIHTIHTHHTHISHTYHTQVHHTYIPYTHTPYTHITHTHHSYTLTHITHIIIHIISPHHEHTHTQYLKTHHTHIHIIYTHITHTPHIYMHKHHIYTYTHIIYTHHTPLPTLRWGKTELTWLKVGSEKQKVTQLCHLLPHVFLSFGSVPKMGSSMGCWGLSTFY